MVKRILNNAGFVEGETYRECRFVSPPKTTYAVFFDSFSRRGADGLNLIKAHSYTIELYADSPDPSAEARIENVFDLFGIEYEKLDRTYIASEHLYQTIYNFDHIEK